MSVQTEKLERRLAIRVITKEIVSEIVEIWNLKEKKYINRHGKFIIYIL